MNRAELQNLAHIRLHEARALLAAGHPNGAYYLAGYSVECALKAVIARQTQQYDFPDKGRALESFVHDPRKLVKAAQLTSQLDAQIDANSAFYRYWRLVSDWSEASRYDVHTQADATDIIEAVGDSNEGVLQWVTQYW
jgi:HEPN domain-containing protein